MAEIKGQKQMQKPDFGVGGGGFGESVENAGDAEPKR